MKAFRAAICTIAILCMAASAWGGYVSAPNGYTVHDTVFELPAGAYPASFDILPDGSFVVHTGADILRVAEDNATEVLYSYEGEPWGSFVTVDQARGRLFFGESSTGVVSVMDLDGGNPRNIAAVPYHFDLGVNSRGQVFVTSTPGFGSGVCDISMLDAETGALDLIAQVPGATGPLGFDKKDNLVYGTVSTIWGQHGGQSILRWTDQQVISAFGEGSLTEADAEALAGDVDSAYDLAFDVTDRICCTSTVSSPSTVWRLNPGSVDALTWVDPATFHYLTVVRWNKRANGISVMVGGVFDSSWRATGVISTLVRGEGH